MAVAGFSPAELDITVQENTLLGARLRRRTRTAAATCTAASPAAFERRFSLADHMKVVGASLDNGMLSVDVVRPEFRGASVLSSRARDPRAVPSARQQRRHDLNPQNTTASATRSGCQRV